MATAPTPVSAGIEAVSMVAIDQTKRPTTTLASIPNARNPKPTRHANNLAAAWRSPPIVSTINVAFVHPSTALRSIRTIAVG